LGCEEAGGRRASCGRGRFLPPGALGIAGCAARMAGRAPGPARGSPPDLCTEMPGRPAAAAATARCAPGRRTEGHLGPMRPRPARRSRQALRPAQMRRAISPPADPRDVHACGPGRAAHRSAPRPRAPVRAPLPRPACPLVGPRRHATRPHPWPPTPTPRPAPPRPAAAAAACAPKGKIGSPGAAARAEAHL